jgi:ATP-dependent helicase/nuclease subunit A
MKLSLSQKQALDPRFSCWVEASAGTGKTKVLTDRVLSLLLSGAEVSDILCLTFTKAAGAEMANRLRYRLHQWATLKPAALRQELEDFLGPSFSEEYVEKARHLFGTVLDAAYGVRIQTIHGFCQSLLRAFPLEAGLLPHFKIMTDMERRQLIEESYVELWKRLGEEEIKEVIPYLGESQFQQFLEVFLEHQEELSQLSIKELTHNLLSQPLFSFSKERVSIEGFLQQSILPDPIILSFEKATPSDLKLCQSLIEFGQYALEEKISRFHEYKSLFLTGEGNIRKRIFSTSVQTNFPKVSRALEEEARNVVHMHEILIKKKIADRSLLLMQIAQKFIKIYQGIKSKNAWLDYDDLIIHARDLFKKSYMKPWILEKLDYKLKHILVDEAQDTSQIQWELILALIEEFYADNTSNIPRTLFVVGDLKQSIYSFQGACPQAFVKAKEAFQKLPRYRMISLSTSYRSTPAVLQFVDRVFKSPTFNSSSHPPLHQIFRKDTLGVVELWPLVKKESRTERKEWEISESHAIEEDTRRILAEKIASQLKRWFERGEVLHSHNRLLEPRDIMILVRRRDAFMEELVKALKVKGIPVTGLDRMVLTDQLVVKDLLCLCDSLLLPEDDLSLATLLKTPFFGMSEEEIFQLCHNRGDHTLWDHIKTLSSYEGIVARFLTLQKAMQERPLSSFFSFTLLRWGGRKRLLERLGPEIEDVLEEFLCVSREYESTYGSDLQQFVFWIRQQNIEVKRSLEQTTDNQVRIMTVHGAKGLQAPIVFLPDTTQIPISQSSLYWHESPPFLVWTDREFRKLPDAEIWFRKDQELQEYYRLLYVALTRAEDRLYICGWETQKNRDSQAWYTLLENTMKEIGTIVQIESMGEGRRYGTLTQGDSIKRKICSTGELGPNLPGWLKKPWREKQVSDLAPSLFGVKPTSSLPSPLSTRKETGILIHKILQWIVLAEESQREDLVKRYLETLPFSDFEQTRISTAVKAVLEHSDFSTFFNKKTRTEVSIQGYWKGRQMRGILDVLTICEQEKNVYILDYKTGTFLEIYRKFPPQEYIQQMSIYKKLIQEIYPKYKIISALLWTEIGWIQKL